MTPKEKAEELVNDFHEIICDGGSLSSKVLSYQKAKQCALIAVNEMIAFAKHAFSYINIELATPSITYLEEVKQEIEKL